ncbi:MAG: thioredoxin family protein [Acidimicrobiales bacterium]
MAIVDALGSPGFELEVLSCEHPVVVGFWVPSSDSSGPPDLALESAAGASPGAVSLVRVDMDSSPGIAERFGVMGLPTLALFWRGSLIATASGRQASRAIAAELARLPSVEGPRPVGVGRTAYRTA